MTTLKTFDFASTQGRGSYDWATLTDGRIHRLERGVDFTAKYIRAQIMVYAKAKGLKVRLSAGYPHSDHVVLQFITDAPAKKQRTRKAKTDKQAVSEHNAEVNSYKTTA